MKTELHRQLVHLSGVLFVILGYLTGKYLTAAYFFLIAFTFLLYSEYVRREQKRVLRFIKKVEDTIRKIALDLERPNIQRPFMGAFWFYFGCGLTFLFFPMEVAIPSCLILSVGDALSTLVGVNFGKHKLLPNKSVEGSATLLISSFLISAFFFSPLIAVIAAITATFAEILPSITRDKLNDNLTIPLLTGIAVFAATTI